MNFNCMFILNQIHHLSDVHLQIRASIIHMVIQIMDEPYITNFKTI